MLTLTLLLGLIAGPTSSPAVGDTSPVAVRSGPTLQALRAGMSQTGASKTRIIPTAVQGPQRQTAVIGAVVGGVLGLAVSAAFAGDSDSTGGGAGSVLLTTVGGALVGFVVGALIAGPS